MNKLNIAVLLTCHNRRTKTITCLESFYQANIPSGYHFDIYLTDDGSTDGTGEAVRELFPDVNVIQGDGNLFWAGGMRLTWKTAMELKSYDAYLLINDDVLLHQDFMLNLLEADAHSISETGQQGIYSGATVDENGQLTYGGSIITQNHLIMNAQKVAPKSHPQRCDLTNANVLWISSSVVDKIGIFDKRYTHGIADYDYSRRAIENKIPVWLAPNVCGVCTHDHGNNWKSSNKPLKERIEWMKSPKGLAYSEYMYYIRKHFPVYLPYSFIMMWMKTFFPFIWDRFKN
ncbi:glycosyltransferase family 2 protein [Proteiniphilum saccharofermentans]|uniref:glycosyltransferase family 2 protein n=1 Tax=Proteiniphilum saccharofermentans TaxID=1642647 RepID=UPI0028A8A733|nr:glycosyltransferase family 2 protein [Proteiniphilum saccharofermentans]